MTTYVIETYLSREHPEELDEATRRLRAAAATVDAGSAAISYVRSVFVPADETCFHVVEAPSMRAAASLADLAAITPERIVQARAAGGP